MSVSVPEGEAAVSSEHLKSDVLGTGGIVFLVVAAAAPLTAVTSGFSIRASRLTA